LSKKASFKQKQFRREEIRLTKKNRDVSPDVLYLKNIGIIASEEKASEIISNIQRLVKEKRINIELAVKLWKASLQEKK